MPTIIFELTPRTITAFIVTGINSASFTADHAVGFMGMRPHMVTLVKYLAPSSQD